MSTPMTDDKKSGYTYTTQTEGVSANLDLAELEKVMKEFREKFDDDISRALFAKRPNPLLEMKPPRFEYEPEERPYAINWRHSFGMAPVYESEFIPRGEGVAVAGHGIVIGTGPAHETIDKLGIDLGTIYYALPKWAAFAILAAIMIILVLMLA